MWMGWTLLLFPARAPRNQNGLSWAADDGHNTEIAASKRISWLGADVVSTYHRRIRPAAIPLPLGCGKSAGLAAKKFSANFNLKMRLAACLPYQPVEKSRF